MPRFLVFLAEGFEEIEALSVVDLLRRANIDALTVGVGAKHVAGSHGIRVECDITENEIYGYFDGIVLPGGMPGTLNLEKSETVKKHVDKAVKDGKYVCAICAAPLILGHMGILQGKRAVCYPGYEEDLHGAEVMNYPVCVDGKIITARGAGVAVDFALEIISQVCDLNTAENIRSEIICCG